MFPRIRKKQTADTLNDIRTRIRLASDENDTETILNVLQPVINVQAHQKLSALALVDIIREGNLTTEKSLELLNQVHDSYPDDDEVTGDIALALESARDMDDLNAPPPESELFKTIVEKLRQISKKEQGSEKEALYIEGLSSAARLCSRQYDSLAEESYSRLVDLLPETPWAHYNQGLFFKTRGEFRRGVSANQKAIELAESPSQAYYWNLGICATGAGEGETALEIWKNQGQNIEMGRFNLPEGRYPSCKVKLSRYPLAERNIENDYPGIEETIWIERLSPCHGIVRSVLYEDLGVDYGDVVLFDGAPITYHLYGEQKIAVFPHLATLVKRGYQFFDFCGTQKEAGVLGQISETLNGDAVIYSHSENYQILCSACWNNKDLQHEHDEKDEKHVVTGRIAMPPNANATDLLNKIDKALQDDPRNRIFSPDLCVAAGFSDRAQIEKRRFRILSSSD